jgi:hypothetical protein
MADAFVLHILGHTAQISVTTFFRREKSWYFFEYSVSKSFS